MSSDHDISRKDFINATLVGVGAALLHAPSPLQAAEQSAQRADTFTGPGGVGDYASSNGNTKAVMDAAHRIRDGAYNGKLKPADTGEIYDLVVVGGGITGLSAAYWFDKSTNGKKTCLVLENHPIFGGEAKQNEFVVNGTRLIAPQGSNDFGVPRGGAGNWQSEMWDDLRMPRQFEWSGAHDPSMTLRMAQDNYQPMDGIGEFGIDIGYYIEGSWKRNIWQNQLAGLPVAPEVRAQLLKWRTEPPVDARPPEQFARFLDTLTYADYLKSLGYGPEVVKTIEPVIGLINGASPDAVSAHAAQQIGMPAVSRPRSTTNASLGLSFPGGNVTYTRHLVKKLIPNAITAEFSFEGILNGRVNWNALDARGHSTRIRVGTTVARVAHLGEGRRDMVEVIYAKNGELHRVRARRVAMATGGWVTKHVLADIPQEMAFAYSQFYYAPALIINVALNNWRFMYDLGITAARWYEDDPRNIGFVANIRRQMKVGSYDAPVDPDKPTVLTFYLGLYTPGKPIAEQGSLGRNKLLGTSYREYENAILSQLTRMFPEFASKRDVAGVILNRWGHARLAQPPGWYYGTEGRPAPREVVSAGYGKIAIGHSELNGHQTAAGAIAQGKRIGELGA